MVMSQATLKPGRKKVRSPLSIRNCALWMRPDDGVYTGGCRTLTAGDKSCFQIADASQTGLDPLASDFSVCGWINPSSIAAGTAVEIAKGNEAATDVGWCIYRSTANLIFRCGDGSDTVSVTLGTMTAGAWHFFAVTVDRDGNATGYMNNVANGSPQAMAAIGSMNSSDAFSIGASSAQANHAGASFASIAVANRLWTVAELTYMFNLKNNKVYAELGIAGTDGAALLTNLVSYWNCNETDPTTGLVDQHSTNDLTRTAAELLTNTGFETRGGRVWASFAAGDKAHLEAADNATLDYGTGDFLNLASIYRTSTGNQVLYSKYEDANNYTRWEIDSSHHQHFIAVVGGVTKIEMTGTTALSSTSAAYTLGLAVDRSDATKCRFYVNGAVDPCGTIPSGVELIATNAGFETYTGTQDDGTGDSFTAYTNVNQSQGRNEATATAHSGTNAVKIVTLTVSGQGRIRRTVSVSPSCRYRWTFWTRGDGTNGGLYKLVDATNTVDISLTGTGVTGTTYTQVTVDFSTPATCSSVYLELQCSGLIGAVVYFDDLSCQQLLPVTSADDISNAGKLYVGQSGASTLYFDGKLAQLGIGKPADVSAAAVNTAMIAYHNSGIGMYYFTLHAGGYDTTLGITSWWDMHEASGNRTDDVGGMTLREVLTTELVTNGTFGADSDWTKGAGWSIGSGVATNDGSSGSLSNLTSIGTPLVAGRQYVTKLTITSYTSGAGVRFYHGSWPYYTAPSTYTLTVAAAETSVHLQCAANYSGSIDDVSVKAASIPCSVDAGLFSGWTGQFYGTGTINDDTDIAGKAGNHAMRMDGSSVANYAQIYQAVLTVGNAYTFSVDAKSASGTPNIRLFLGSNYSDIALSTTFGTKTYSGTCAGTANAYVLFAPSSANSAYVDTATVKSAAIAVGNGPSEAIASDSVGTAHGTFSGVSAAGLVMNWIPRGTTGYAFYFDGTDDTLLGGNLGNVTRITFDVKSAVADQELMTLANSTATAIKVSSGTLSFGASLSASNITVDGVSKTAAQAGALINDGAWHTVAFDLTSIAASNVKLATDSSAFGNITLDNVSFLLSAAATHTYLFDDGPFGIPGEGDPVWGWESLEGNRSLFSQPTAGSRPVYHLAEANSRPALYFDGTDDLLNLVSAALTGTQGTAMIVAKLDGTTASRTFLSSSDTATTSKYLQLGTNASSQIQTIQDNTDTDDIVRGGSTVNTNLHAYFFESDGSAYTLAIDNVNETKTVVGGADNGDWWDDSTGKDNIVIGALTTTSSSLFFKGWVFDIVVYSTKLTTGQRNSLWKDYVRKTYAL